jgi:hypothetical protein
VAPLAVWLGLKLPQFGALEHVATQSTPAFAGSFVTAAETCATLLTTIGLLGGCVMATEISGVWLRVLVAE